MMDPSLSNSTLMDLLNATDSSPCTCRLSSLACLNSVPSDHLPSCSLWHRRCSLVPDTFCLQHFVDSLVLSYTLSLSVDPSHRTLKSFSTCANLKCTCTFVSVQFTFLVYVHTYADRQTYVHTHTSCNAVTLVQGSLRLTPVKRRHRLHT